MFNNRIIITIQHLLSPHTVNYYSNKAVSGCNYNMLSYSIHAAYVAFS